MRNFQRTLKLTTQTSNQKIQNPISKPKTRSFAFKTPNSNSKTPNSNLPSQNLKQESKLQNGSSNPKRQTPNSQHKTPNWIHQSGARHAPGALGMKRLPNASVLLPSGRAAPLSLQAKLQAGFNDSGRVARLCLVAGNDCQMLAPCGRRGA